MRTVVALVAATSALCGSAVVFAQNTPRACAVLVSTDGSTITDPAHASCQAGGSFALLFCNNSMAEITTVTLSKTMSLLGAMQYATLRNDIVIRNIKSKDCRFALGVFATNFGSSVPYGVYKYTVTADKIPPLDPDLDVSPPTGLPEGRPPARRGRGAQPQK